MPPIKDSDSMSENPHKRQLLSCTRCQTFLEKIRSISIAHYFTAGIILLLVGILVKDTRHILGAFISEIGIAFIVSAIIGLSIEEKHKKSFSDLAKQQIDNFKSNTFQSLFGWSVPKIYIQLIQEQITALHFYRNSLEIEYILHEINKFPIDIPSEILKNGNLVFIESRHKFTVTNIRTVDKNYCFSFTLDKDVYSQYNHATSIIIETEDKYLNLSKDELKGYLCKKSINDTFEHTYIIPEICVKPNKTLRAEIISYAPRLEIYNKETFDTFYFTENVSVIATNFPKEFSITCETSTEKNMPFSESLNSTRWKNTKPLLPNQSVVFRWKNHIPPA